MVSSRFDGKGGKKSRRIEVQDGFAMMKTIVGVDLTGAFEHAVQLFRQMKFGESAMHFVNVVEPVMPDGTFPELATSHPVAQILDDLKSAGQSMLDRAKADWPNSSTQVAFGSAASTLIQIADDHSADLVMVGSREKSILESIFAGSVTKAMTSSSTRPVLIGKKDSAATDGLTVVIAYDLSEYCEKALDRFVEWSPKGIGRIVLVTADTTDPSIVAVAEHIEPRMAGETMDIVNARIQQRHAAVSDKLLEVCTRVESVIVQESPKYAIDSVMKSCAADLLILGAHGHGFVERLVIGSLAMHEVVREPHNVLLMRA